MEHAESSGERVTPLSQREHEGAFGLQLLARRVLKLVDKQSGAYATGMPVLMLSASFASTVAAHHRGHTRARAGFDVITAVFCYTLVAHVAERPDGLKTAAILILAILVTSFGSRVHRAFELRVGEVILDDRAQRILDDAAAERPLHLIAHDPQEGSSRLRPWQDVQEARPLGGGGPAPAGWRGSTSPSTPRTACTPLPSSTASPPP
ncbi:hypothetical protein [Streptomyces sparsogenes]|uniref:hypothetical protein n=1 Tax=Streptomyces sparsogenes TaxID=67365 RepID=UPI003D9F9C42